MMSLDSFTRANEDILRTVTITSDGSTALDTSNFTEIIVRVIHKKFRTTIAELVYTESGVTLGDPTSDGEISFIVSRAATASQPLGTYIYEVETQEADASYLSSVRKRNFVGDCFSLIKELGDTT